MKTADIRIGMSVRHPQYGIGTVKSISEHTTDIRFNDSTRTISPDSAGLEAAEPQIAISGLEGPLAVFVNDIVAKAIKDATQEKDDAAIEGLGARWHGGKVVMHPADPTLQTKEVPLEAFFHKIVMMRNNFRVLEQKINANDKLTDGEKVDMQQYITRCYGSMTTFNVLFKSKDDYFSGQAG